MKAKGPPVIHDSDVFSIKVYHPLFRNTINVADPTRVETPPLGFARYDPEYKGL